MQQMVKDWKTFREMALALAADGLIPVYGDFCLEMEEVVIECIHLLQKRGAKKATLLINSNGGKNDCFTAIRATMFLSGIEFTGLVMSRARSNGFRLLQVCTTRKALVNSGLMFHWGSTSLENSELAAIMAGQTWVIDHIKERNSAWLQETSERTKVPIDELVSYALYERDFTAAEALALGFIDEVVTAPPVPSKPLEEQLGPGDTAK
jgi:ATP-dependent protease ClpP protease subunit